jgi:hypothetical protein
MDTKTIREAVLTRPFKAFTLRMNDGRRYHIPHPEYVAVSRRVVMVIDSGTEAGVYLEPILISSLHFDDGETKLKPEANGDHPQG